MTIADSVVLQACAAFPNLKCVFQPIINSQLKQVNCFLLGKVKKPLKITYKTTELKN